MSQAREDALQWLRYAEEDLEQARRILEQEDFVPRHAAWLAQQAAEKALKAALVLERVSFPRTHDLDLLSRLLPSAWSVLELEVDFARLTEYAVDARYPGDWPDISEREAEAAFDDAERLFGRLSSVLLDGA